MKKNNKKLLIIVLLLVIIVSILLLLRSCNKKDTTVEETSKETTINETIETPIEEETKEVIEEVKDEVKVEELVKDNSNYSYYVNFLNKDGSLLQRSIYKYGETPKYNGQTPTYKDGIYNYSFIGWDKSFSKVYSSQTYTARYSLSYINDEPTIIAPVANTLTYNGQAQELITVGSISSGTLEYKLAGGNYSIKIPTATDAGNYIVYYKESGSNNDEGSVTVTINKAQTQISVDQTAIVKKYGETLTIPTATSNYGSVNCDKTVQDLKDVGTYTITYTVDEANNFLSDTKTVSVTINKRNVTLTSSSGSKTYDGDPLTNSNVTVSNDGFASGEGATYSVSGTQTTYGTSKNTFTYTLNNNTKADNYNITTVEGDLTINKAKVTVPTANTNLVYSGSGQIGVTLPSNAKYSLSSYSGTNANSYTANATLSDKTNYEWDLTTPTSDDQSISWKIEKAKVNEPSVSGTYTYSGSGQTVTLTGVESYMSRSGSLNQTNAGNYNIVYTLDNNHEWNTGSDGTITWTINKAEAIICTSGVTKEYTYNGTLQTVNSGATVNSGGTLSYSGNTFTDVPSNSGKQTITIYASETDNYKATSTTVEITVNKADQTAPVVPTYAASTSGSLTINTISTSGHGDLEYGINTENKIPETWQESTEFKDLTEGTSYYFFARYAGDKNYASASSSGVNLGLGYTVTIKEYTDCTDIGNDILMNINLTDGSVSQVLFKYDKDSSSGLSATVNYNNESTKETVVSSYNYYNVKSLNLENNDQKLYIVYNDGEIDKTLDNVNSNVLYLCENKKDITITKIGISECIDENSLITMADGSLKAMKDIEVGDEVLSIDYEAMTLVSRKVIYTSKDEADYDKWTVPCYYLHTFSDGTVIKRAMRHRFYCLEEEGYKHMDYWENGLHAYKIDGSNPTLLSTEIIQEELHYARITLEGSNNYFANGLSTGDSECCPNKVILNEKLELIIEK